MHWQKHQLCLKKQIQAANIRLLQHYKETFGAIQLDGLRFYIDDIAAEKLLEKYRWSEEDEEKH